MIGDCLRKLYSPNGARKFDCDMMLSAYGKKFQVTVCAAEKVPPAKESQTAAGGHCAGCRIGFDLGASDYKVSAVVDGEVIFTEETPWAQEPVEPRVSLSSYFRRAASRRRAFAARGRDWRQFGRHHRGQ